MHYLYPVKICFPFLILIMGYSSPADSQVCQGSLGDPIVMRNFGAGQNPGQALPSASTSYNYIPADCPNDGAYTIRNLSTGCFNWHTLASDHTGNTNGYFMLVNASYQPSLFFLDTVDLVCSNMNYVFSAWVVNMNKPEECGGNLIRPNLTFNIEKTDGSILQTYNSGDIPPRPSIFWEQYGFFFTTPANVSRVVLKITNNAPGGCGNDLAIDDISFRPCGPSVTASVDGGSELRFCEKENITADFQSAVPPDFLDPWFQWQMSADSGNTWIDMPGFNSPSFVRNFASATTGSYFYRVGVTKMENRELSSCRFYSAILKIDILSTPVAEAGPDKTIIKGQSVKLDGSVSGSNFSYVWNPPVNIDDISNLVPVVHPDQTLKYTLTATSNYGCGSSADSVMVRVFGGLFIPTAFTPNNDGKNDKWIIQALAGFNDYDIRVYDRYGQLIYHSNNATAGWNGKYKGEYVNPGVYIYLVSIKNTSLNFKGTLTIIR